MKIQINDFTQSIFETTLPINNKLYNKVKKQKLTRYKHLKSNYDNSINKKLFDEIKNYLQEYVNYVGRILKREKNIIEYMWFQKYSISDHHDIHCHSLGKNNYSFILYVDCGSKSGDTRFVNIGYPYVQLNEHRVKPVKGKCLIFLGAIPHESLPSRDNKKTIVSGNIVYQ